MKVELKDNNNAPVIGWKYWAAIGLVVGGAASLGGEFPNLTPLSIIDSAYESTQCE
jgi:hypothetical protein